ncbi:MAG TPA: hypothetical protein VGC72_07650 [Candidatus Elarobacter sp.]|jgi:hypothetical protein
MSVVVLCAVVAAMSAQPASAHGSYYPHVPGKPAGVADGVLVNFGVGQSAGDVTIRQSNSKERSFYLGAHPFVIDGKAVDCVMPPLPPYSPPPAVCRWWPSNVKIGSTRVRVFYWRDSRFGHPTLVTRELRTLK